jgi:hypothetical protein
MGLTDPGEAEDAVAGGSGRLGTRLRRLAGARDNGGEAIGEHAQTATAVTAAAAFCGEPLP